MKKVLLLCVLGALCSGVQAASFSDLYKVTYNGQTLTDGQTLVITDNTFESYEDYGDEYDYWSFAHVNITVEGTGTEDRALYGELSTISPATRDAFVASGASGSLCYANSPVLGGTCSMAGNAANSLGATYVNVGPLGWVDNSGFGSGKAFEWQIHYSVEGLKGQVEASTPRELKLVMTACDGVCTTSQVNATMLPETFTVNIYYTSDEASVPTIGTAAKGHARYYSIDGRELQGPSKGLYIEQLDGKSLKKIGK